MPIQEGEFHPLPTLRGKTFKDSTIFLDGNAYVNCTFERCVLIYRGGLSKMDACYVGPNCEWRIADAAANTLQFLQSVGWKIIPPAAVTL
jgi:hypothetical protein